MIDAPGKLAPRWNSAMAMSTKGEVEYPSDISKYLAARSALARAEPRFSTANSVASSRESPQVAERMRVRPRHATTMAVTAAGTTKWRDAAGRRNKRSHSASNTPRRAR
ncbi:hypothetical protein D3C75_587060 [compost metagenome]